MRFMIRRFVNIIDFTVEHILDRVRLEIQLTYYFLAIILELFRVFK